MKIMLFCEKSKLLWSLALSFELVSFYIEEIPTTSPRSIKMTARIMKQMD